MKSILKVALDGWANVLTGLGIKNVDKSLTNSITWEPLGEIDAEELYCASDIAGTIIDDLPDEAMREGWNLQFKEAEQLKKAITDEENRLNLHEVINTAWKHGRLYGGGAILIVTPDMSLDQPLTIENIQKISSLLVVSRYELVNQGIDNDIRSPNFGQPRWYMVQPRSGGALNMRVHHTRVIRFDGAKLPRQKFTKNNYWHDSVLTKLGKIIGNYDVSHEALALLLQDMSVAVHKVHGLKDSMLAEGGDEQILKRMQIVNATRSIARSVVIDAENESFEYQQRNLSGVKEVVDLISNRLVAASKMPHTRLLGESPSGLGATGNSEMTNWYDYVANQQEVYLKAKLMKLYEVIFAAKTGPTKGTIPVGLDINFCPLFQMTDKELADVRKVQADTDNVYVSMGAVDPMEIRDSRFGGPKFSHETKIDKSLEVVKPGTEEKSEEEKSEKKEGETN